MESIIGLNEILSINPGFDIHQLRIITEFKLSSEFIESAILEITIRTAFENENFQVKLRFIGVRDLSLKVLDRYQIYINGFDIINCKERQLENINWEINDYEDGRLFFYCNTVEIIDGAFLQ